MPWLAPACAARGAGVASAAARASKAATPQRRTCSDLIRCQEDSAVRGVSTEEQPVMNESPLIFARASGIDFFAVRLVRSDARGRVGPAGTHRKARDRAEQARGPAVSSSRTSRVARATSLDEEARLDSPC